MSYTETHTSMFKILAVGKDNVLNYIKEHKIEDEFTIYSETDNELEIESINKKYDVDYRGKWLIEYSLHDTDEDDEYFVTSYKTVTGSCIVNARFHNGGTCWHEILDEEIEKLINDGVTVG